jgi:hypothetical protein
MCPIDPNRLAESAALRHMKLCTDSTPVLTARAIAEPGSGTSASHTSRERRQRKGLQKGTRANSGEDARSHCRLASQQDRFLAWRSSSLMVHPSICRTASLGILEKTTYRSLRLLAVECMVLDATGLRHICVLYDHEPEARHGGGPPVLLGMTQLDAKA